MKVFVVKTHHDCPNKGEHHSRVALVTTSRDLARAEALKYIKQAENRLVNEEASDYDLDKYYDEPDGLELYNRMTDEKYTAYVKETEVIKPTKTKVKINLELLLERNEDESTEETLERIRTMIEQGGLSEYINEDNLVSIEDEK